MERKYRESADNSNLLFGSTNNSIKIDESIEMFVGPFYWESPSRNAVVSILMNKIKTECIYRISFMHCIENTHSYPTNSTQKEHENAHNLWLKIILLFAIEQDRSTICVALQQHQSFYKDVLDVYVFFFGHNSFQSDFHAFSIDSNRHLFRIFSNT